jgi:hypothetical protein
MGMHVLILLAWQSHMFWNCLRRTCRDNPHHDLPWSITVLALERRGAVIGRTDKVGQEHECILRLIRNYRIFWLHGITSCKRASRPI